MLLLCITCFQRPNLGLYQNGYHKQYSFLLRSKVLPRDFLLFFWWHLGGVRRHSGGRKQSSDAYSVARASLGGERFSEAE